MRYLALATDYDGTLATHGSVEPEAVDALERLRASGRKALLVTGRELDDLHGVFDRIDVFDRVVAENGALIYRPETRETELLASGPPAGFAEELGRRGVEPVSVGHVVVATWEPHEATVLETIRDMGLELQVIFNKGAVMVLPSGINKATGMAEALRELGLSAHNVVGVGDAENDHAFLELCEASVAVANALDSLKERCDHVTKSTHGAGLRELIEGLLEDDLAWLRPARHRIPVGTGGARGGGSPEPRDTSERQANTPPTDRGAGEEVWIEPSGSHVLVAGPSGSGKSMLTTSFLERLSDAGYQFCLIDPEGDYSELEGAVKLGDQERAPSVTEVLELLENPDDSVVVNLLGIQLDERPAFFDALVPRLQELRAQRGRPHWIVIDEAHHLLPAEREPSDVTLPRVLEGTWMITVHPDRVARDALEAVDVLFAVGRFPEETVRAVAEVTGTEVPDLPTAEEGRVVAWFRDAGDPFSFEVAPPRTELRRHKRKYMRGDLHEKAFHFRGPEGMLDLRAQNLAMFMQIGDGVDEETWLHHLRRADYSRWFREAIKDEALAEAAERLEREESISADEARSRLRKAIEERYTLPA